MTKWARSRRCAGCNYPFLTSKERDNETGLDYFLARYYSSTQGRFTSPDAPFADQWEEDPQSWNLYAYVANNPLVYTDPFGLWKEIQCTSGKGQCWQAEKDDTLTSLAEKLKVSPSQLDNFFQNPEVIQIGQEFDVSGFWSWRSQSGSFVGFVDLVTEDQIPGDKYSFEINIGPPVPGGTISRRTAQKLWNERGQILKHLKKDDFRLLGELFGQGKRGKLKDLKDFKIPQGLTKQTLERYAEIARRAVQSGNDKSGVQKDRLDLIERALKTMKD